MQSVLEAAWLNDRIVPIADYLVSGDDPGLTLGDGLFETMLVRDGVAIARDAHLRRFEASRRALVLPAPPVDPVVAIDALLAEARAQQQVGELALRVTLTARPTLLVRVRALSERDHARRRGLELHRLPTPRGESFMARHKALAWAANAVVRRLHPAGHDERFEGLWLDPAGHVLEGTSTNVFARLDGVYVTPPTSAPILPGVERARLLAYLSERGIPHAEAPLRAADLSLADALFATNAILPIAPVVALDGQPLASATLPDEILSGVLATPG